MLTLIRMLRDWGWNAPEAAPPSADSDMPSTGQASASEWAELWRDGTTGIPRCEKAQKLVRRGVPPLMRAEVWRRCADAVNHPQQMTQPAAGYYETLLARASEQASPLVTTSCARASMIYRATCLAPPTTAFSRQTRARCTRELAERGRPDAPPRRSCALATTTAPSHVASEYAGAAPNLLRYSLSLPLAVHRRARAERPSSNKSTKTCTARSARFRACACHSRRRLPHSAMFSWHVRRAHPLSPGLAPALSTPARRARYV